ncbi:GNAT family N-acetyltransferase [Solihabitans fulvus]|uniref:GNAT family N-acetyltransferase n=1 Tax=Solihabitans fulvus TaxID=1892852 RepID=UPI001661E47C|nr:GNAT family protein [Solihabitans fulvus]
MLTGELVTLRPLEPEDYPTLARFANDVEIALLVGGRPPTPDALPSVVALYEGRREDPHTLGFAIIANNDPGRLIGQCALFNQHQVARTAELGILIGDRDYWGRGCGTEAVSLLADYGFRLRNLHKVHLSVNATNPRAIRAYQKAGFTEEGRRRKHLWNDGEYVDLVLMGRLRDDPPPA